MWSFLFSTFSEMQQTALCDVCRCDTRPSIDKSGTTSDRHRLFVATVVFKGFTRRKSLSKEMTQSEGCAESAHCTRTAGMSLREEYSRQVQSSSRSRCEG